ncbi:FAA hydrolase family protein [Cupriavidus necator]|uniref:FAA hydrolase family protein n=1 Tax=Cupriavidus necator TaxID=106590 RepID=A0A1U9V0M4_CUPNE|nr:FAA hydrolase family protein [Cupriavidus necator]
MTVFETAGTLYLLDALIAKAGTVTPGQTGVLEVIEQWDTWRPILTTLAANAAGVQPLERDRLEWLPAIPNPRKIVCVGVNYRDHLAEMGSGAVRPERPFAFIKPQNTLLGHRQTLWLPPVTRKVDWEAELAIIIGRKAFQVAAKDALKVVAGYCPFNDISARDWIADLVPGLGQDWILHKSFDGFGPLGPLVTPAEFVRDPQNLAIRLSVNGEVKQDSSTANMVFDIASIIEYFSSVMTLMPGDIIATGTPAGVGHGRGEYLKDGDKVSLSIECLGELDTEVRRR